MPTPGLGPGAKLPRLRPPLKAAQPVSRAGGVAQTVAPVVGKVASTYLIVLGVVAAVLFLGFFLLMGKVAGG